VRSAAVEPVRRASHNRALFGNGGATTMSRLDEVQQKLTAAVERLEAAYRAREDTGPAASAVQDELAELKAEHDSLREVTSDVASELDETIERLEKLLTD
jgi:septation ring formation regulator EzrA